MRTQSGSQQGPIYTKKALELLISQYPAPLSSATLANSLEINPKRASQVLRLICDKGFATRVGWGLYQLNDLTAAKEWLSTGLLWGQFKGTPIGKRQSHPID